MKKYIIETYDLCKKSGNKFRVKNVNLAVPKGCIYGFLGPNGAGKTTTMKLLLGLIQPDGGTVEVLGQKMSPKNRFDINMRTGSLIESPGFYGHLTGQENLEIIARYKNLGTDDIKEALNTVHLYDRKDDKVKNYSLGMKQRLGIAMALINNPEMLILDEPVNGLDPMGMVDVRELLISLCRDDGITIVISSHILAELYQLATDYIIISHGRIISTFSKNALDNLCTTHIVMNTECNDTALEILAANGMSGVDNDEGTIMIFDNVDTRDVAKLMHDHNLLVTHLAKHERTLEEYYIELLGRGA